MTADSPGCVLFLVDQSISMDDRMASRVPKSYAVADALNRLLSGLLGRCVDGTTTRDFLHVGVLGYSERVHPQLARKRGAAQALLPISEIASTGRPGFVLPGPSDGHGRLVKVRPWPLYVWVEPRTGPYTSMCAALRQAATVIGSFVAEHPNGFPPIVINLTDGEATDGDPTPASRALTSISSRNGGVLLFNLHMSTTHDAPLEYPSDVPNVRDRYAAVLFAMSSVLPDRMREAAAAMHHSVAPGARGFAFNANMASLARFLDIGIPSSLLAARRSDADRGRS